MNLSENINRILTAKEAIKTAISNHGVEVPEGTSIDFFPDYINAIEGGSDDDGTWGDYLTGSLLELTPENIPNNVDRIGDRVFEYSDIESVHLPSNIRELGEAVFKNSKVGRADLSESRIWLLPKSAFEGSELYEIVFPTTLSHIDNSAFAGCQNLNFDSLNPLVMPSRVLMLGDNIFANCENLNSISFANSNMIPSLSEFTFENSQFIKEDWECPIIVPDELYDEWRDTENWNVEPIRRQLQPVSGWQYGNFDLSTETDYSRTIGEAVKTITFTTPEEYSHGLNVDFDSFEAYNTETGDIVRFNHSNGLKFECEREEGIGDGRWEISVQEGVITADYGRQSNNWFNFSIEIRVVPSFEFTYATANNGETFNNEYCENLRDVRLYTDIDYSGIENGNDTWYDVHDDWDMDYKVTMTNLNTGRTVDCHVNPDGRIDVDVNSWDDENLGLWKLHIPFGAFKNNMTDEVNKEQNFYWLIAREDDVRNNPLRFTAIEDNTQLQFNVRGTSTSFLSNDISYRMNGEIDWQSYRPQREDYGNEVTITLNEGEYIEFMNSSHYYTTANESVGKYHKFKTPNNKPLICSGSIMSMLSYRDDKWGSSYCCPSLFYGCSITSTPYMPDLSEIGLGNGAFYRLFSGTSIRRIPEMTLNVYNAQSIEMMFQGCGNLYNADPVKINISTIQSNQNIFQNCTSLVHAPKLLPYIENLNNNWGHFFENCSSLKELWFENPNGISSLTDIGENWLNTNSNGTVFMPNNMVMNEDEIRNFGWDISVYYAPTPQPEDTFTGLRLKQVSPEGGSVTLNQIGSVSNLGNLEYQVNNDNWSPYEFGTEIQLNEGDNLKFRNDTVYTASNTSYLQFGMTGAVEASGSILSVVNEDENIKSYQFKNLFADCSSLKSAKLTFGSKAPSRCYDGMFKSCSSLEDGPEILPATTVGESAYDCMFTDCTSLCFPPELPATTLGNFCYSNMFCGCSSLWYSPSLPATTLKQYCYSTMFKNCTNLGGEPHLPATTGVNNCYAEMFSGCTKLNSVKCNLLEIKYAYSKQWLKDVPENGKFYQNPNTKFPTRGEDGIPTTWTIEDWVM